MNIILGYGIISFVIFLTKMFLFIRFLRKYLKEVRVDFKRELLSSSSNLREVALIQNGSIVVDTFLWPLILPLIIVTLAMSRASSIRWTIEQFIDFESRIRKSLSSKIMMSIVKDNIVLATTHSDSWIREMAKKVYDSKNNI